MATKHTSGSHSKSFPGPSPLKKLKHDTSFQESSSLSLEPDFEDADSNQLLDQEESDSSFVEADNVEIEEVDVTEEFVVSMDDNSVLLEEDEVSSQSQEVDSLQMVQATTSTPGGELPSEESFSNEKSGPTFVFKDPTFIHSSKGPGGNKRTRIWKNLKQITTAERAMFKDKDCVTYGSIDAPPSFRPAKKYSDISGLEAKYTDPQTKMRYSTAEEFQRVRVLPGDIVTGCLTLRKANALVP